MTTNITPRQAADMLKAGEAILIDVRDNDMYQAEHIAYAASIPVEQLTPQLKALAEQPKKIIFQCMRGIKSQQASSLASELGDRVYNMEGGLIAWKEAGLATLLGKSTSNSPKISLVRQMQITLGIVLLLIFLIPFLTGALGFLGYLVPIIGIVLIAAGTVGCCPLMKILGQMPWNK